MKWISVKERLPEHNQVILIIGRWWNTPQVVTFYIGETIPTSASKEGCSDCSWTEKYRPGVEDGMNYEGFTHWMPLPPPPKVE